MVLLIVVLLWGLERNDGSVGQRMAARLAETLVYVGLGYCTNEGPGVVKFHGVVPMGWTCAVVALLNEHFLLLRGARLLVLGGASFRIFMLVFGLVMQAWQNPPWGEHQHDADQITVGFLVACINTIVVTMYALRPMQQSLH